MTQLGVILPDDAVIDRILQSLPPSYKSFVVNFNMQGMEKTILELYFDAEISGGGDQKGTSSVDGE